MRSKSSISVSESEKDSKSLHEKHSLISKEPRKIMSYYAYIQKKWTNYSQKHHCGLIEVLKQPSIINEVIDSGILINLRRKLLKCMMISETHPYTKRVFKSTTEIRHEETRQLVKYIWMIHPFSRAALWHNFFMAFLYILTLVWIIPTNWAYVRSYYTLKWITFVSDMIVTLNIGLTFCIGYYDKNSVRVVFRPKSVAKRYLMTYFFFDVISCVPSYFIYFFLLANGPTILNALKWVTICRIARIVTIDNTLDIFRLYFGLSAVVYVILQTAVRTFSIILLCLFVAYFLDQLEYIKLYITAAEDSALAKRGTTYTVAHLFGVGKVPIFKTHLDALGFVVTTGLAIFLQLWILCKLFTLWQRHLVNRQTQEDHIQQVGGFVKYKGLPQNIADQINCYFDFQFQRNFYDEQTVYNMLSDNLKKEIPRLRLGRAVELIKFFKVLPNNVVMMIVSNMESTYFCPGDYIFKVNGESTTMYFIKRGTTALFNEQNVEICHLEDDSYYGDISVVLTQIHPVTMMAISPCVLLMLKQRVLKEILHPFPDLQEKVLEITHQTLLHRKCDWNEKQKKRITISEATFRSFSE